MADEDLRNSPTKFNRSYTEAELALFAQYVDQRRRCAPAACDDGPVCWARQGPPALGAKAGLAPCRGCGGRPGELPHNRSTRVRSRA
jgi:hypothetical protein